MKTKDAIRMLGLDGAQELAAALGLSHQAVYKWGGEVPELRRYQIQVLARQSKPSGRKARSKPGAV